MRSSSETAFAGLRCGLDIAEAQAARGEPGEKAGEIVGLLGSERCAVDGVDGQARGS